MLSRRDLLMNFAGGAAVIPLVGSVAANQLQDSAQNKSTSDCSRPLNGPHAHYFPNVVVSTHEGRRALFYDDLLRGKTVLINCMSIKNDAVSRVTKNLANVQRLVRERLGRDLFMYSITIDPEHDTPRRLQAFAEEHQAGAGWTFLTGEPAVIALLRSRLFVSGSDGDHNHAGGPVEDCSLALLRYGNEAVGLWGSIPAKSAPPSIARRLSWIASGQPANEAIARGGPTPSLVESFMSKGRK
jgi:protein SCO1/2